VLFNEVGGVTSRDANMDEVFRKMRIGGGPKDPTSVERTIKAGKKVDDELVDHLIVNRLP